MTWCQVCIQPALPPVHSCKFTRDPGLHSDVQLFLRPPPSPQNLDLRKALRRRVQFLLNTTNSTRRWGFRPCCISVVNFLYFICSQITRKIDAEHFHRCFKSARLVEFCLAVNFTFFTLVYGLFHDSGTVREPHCTFAYACKYQRMVA